MKPPSLPPLPVVLTRLQKLPSLPSAWAWMGPLGRKRLLALQGVLGFVVLALVYEARRQKGKVGHWALAGAKRIGWVVRWRLREWLAWWRLLRFQRKHAYLSGHPFLSAELAGDDAATAGARAASGDKPFTRHVMLGDRGRARCSWALRQQYQSHAYCDVTFLVEGRAFPAHRCWVAAFSQPLGAMFRSGMRESQESRVVLRDTDVGAFQLMLDFIYGGPVELNQDNIECVLELSVRFAVGVLIEQCCNFLASAVAVDTACAILILADKYDCRPLRRDTLLFVVAHLPRCWAAAREHFARLPRALLVEVLAHDALVHGEIVAFHAAVFWLEERRRLLAGGDGGAGLCVVVEEEDEASLVEQVLSHVRFPHMPARLLVEEVEGHPIMQREACKRFVLEAYRYQAVLQRSSSSAAAYHEQQEVLREYAEEMGDRARPRRLPPHAAHRRLALPPLAEEGDDHDDAGQHELLLSSSAPSAAGASSSCSSSSGGGVGVTTVTTHQLVGPAEAMEPPSLPQQHAASSSASRSVSIATATSTSSSGGGGGGGSSATSSMLQYALITTVERHKGDGAM